MKNGTKEERKKVIEHYILAYNAFDVKGMTRDLDDDIVFENISQGEVDLRTEGVDAFTEQAEAATQYFSSREQSIDSWDFEGEKVVVRIVYEAVLAVDLPNGMKVGDTLKLEGSSEFEFRDKKIITIRDRS
ncbi:nuclear transport factor 2 family protein [Flavobacteriaceae bacterium R33]|uniref:Nuclear transport factor 2 family protein n=2 Tax=Poritiphilus flavus TaxID=2697053 RepID=A0A6L9EIF1_9FLAO|nr:nuclear transport factor 2 family protein [Poritiphilus flavus]